MKMTIVVWAKQERPSVCLHVVLESYLRRHLYRRTNPFYYFAYHFYRECSDELLADVTYWLFGEWHSVEVVGVGSYQKN